MGYKLGLDTGGTYTDAVLVDEAFEIIKSAKSLTTHNDLATGLRGATGQVMAGISGSDVELVCLSTTLATNALVEGRGRSVALILIGFNAAQMMRAGLAEALAGDPHVFIDGGHNAGGQQVCELDLQACEQFVRTVHERVDAFAISGVFAVRNPAHETRVQEMIEAVTGKPATCGHHLSAALDAPRRALTALLNARLIPMIDGLLGATRCLLTENQIKAQLMVVKGDGSLISDQVASRYPVETILSGPAASVVGAQYLCKQQRVLVSDIGGTTTDVALITDGRPRLSKDGATVGGWQTMVKAIDVRTFGLGGDSAVVYDMGRRKFEIGPQRVVSLSMFAEHYPDQISALEAQMTLPMSTTHSAQFVMPHIGKSQDLTAAQQELYERIKAGPVPLQTLFRDQTVDRAFLRLEQKALVLRIGFTPTDACHLLGMQHSWINDAARLGAELLMRYSKDNLGLSFSDCQSFARHVLDKVAIKSALALLESASESSDHHDKLSPSQLELLRLGMMSSQGDLFTLKPTLSVPVLGLGAPAASHYPAITELLDAELIQTEHAHVANALGAVVGVIRQQQEITINPAGGKRVVALFPDGPEEFVSLEAGASKAIEVASRLAIEKAVLAGANLPAVDTVRDDNTVLQDGEQIFFESRITATATGRPATE